MLSGARRAAGRRLIRGVPAPVVPGDVIFAHLSGALEPLLFAPAFLAVGWALLKSRRGPQILKEHHD